MNAKRILRTMVILMILSSNVGCDQISKRIVRERLNDNEQISFLNSYLILTKIENSGAFLSVGQSLPKPVKILLLTILPVLALGLALVLLFGRRELSNLTILGVCCIVGGGIGNVYDRIVYGSVTDFLHIDFVLFQTGIFNMADVSIMMGMFIVLAELVLKWRNMSHEIIRINEDE